MTNNNSNTTVIKGSNDKLSFSGLLGDMYAMHVNLLWKIFIVEDWLKYSCWEDYIVRIWIVVGINLCRYMSPTGYEKKKVKIGR